MRGQYMYHMLYTLRERERATQYVHVHVHSTCMDFNFECNQKSVHNSLSNSLTCS